MIEYFNNIIDVKIFKIYNLLGVEFNSFKRSFGSLLKKL